MLTYMFLKTMEPCAGRLKVFEAVPAADGATSARSSALAEGPDARFRKNSAAKPGFRSVALTAKSLPEAVLQRLFAVLLLAVAAQLAWRAHRLP